MSNLELMKLQNPRLNPADLGAIAKVNDLILVTNNVSDLADLSDLKI